MLRRIKHFAVDEAWTQSGWSHVASAWVRRDPGSRIDSLYFT